MTKNDCSVVNNHVEPEKHQVPEDVDVPVPPDGGYGWVVLVAGFLITFIIDDSMYTFGLLLPAIRDYFKATQEEANLIISLNSGLLFLCGPTVAGFSNRFTIRTVIMAGSIGTTLIYILAAFSPNIYFMIVSLGLFGGLFMGATFLPSIWQVSLYFSKKRGIANGITMAGSGVGSFAFPPLVEYLLQRFGWKVTLYILAGIICQCCWCGALMRPLKAKKHKKSVELGNLKTDASAELSGSSESLRQAGIHAEDFSKPMYKKDLLYTGSVQNLTEFKAHHNDVAEFTRSNISIAAVEQKQTCCQTNPACKLITDIVKEMTNFKLLAQNKQFLFISIANFFAFAGFFAVFIYIPIYCKEIEIQNFATLFSIIGMVNIVVRILFGIIADRKIISAFNLNTISFGLVCLANFAIVFLKSFELLIVYSVVFAIGAAGFNSLTTLYLCEIAGLDKLTNANGIISMFRGAGCLLGPYACGFITERIGNTKSAFLFVAFCFLIAVVICMLMTMWNMFKKCCSKDSEELTNSVDYLKQVHN